jgi:predicted O-methyltransferase YrrM
MQDKSYSEKLLPNQEFFRYLYKGQLPFEIALYNLVASYATEFDASRFRLATPTSVGFEQMSTPPWELALLNAFIKFIEAKNVLEVGTFIGHSTMQIARMVGDGGHVTTIEVGREFAELAGQNFRHNGFDDRITLLEGDAGQILDSFAPNSFDLVFVDGSKQDYLDYTLKSGRLLTERGAIVVDDVFFHGDALNDEPSTDKGRGCKRLLTHFAADNSFQKVLLPLANGLLLLYKTRA